MNTDPANFQAWLPILRGLKKGWKLIAFGTIAATAVGAGISFSISPTFSSTTTFIPPQQQQSSAASALASLGNLAGVAGAAAGIKTPADQYVSLLRSERVTDRLIDNFQLMKVYDVDYRATARKRLWVNSTISVGKKDGLISVQVIDTDPTRAASIANAYVSELRNLTNQIAVTEAQQRRLFFEKQLQSTKQTLVAAQTELQSSGLNIGMVKVEPKTAAETYANLKAQLTAARIRLQGIRANLTEAAPEVRQQLATITALEQQLSALEAGNAKSPESSDYIGKYREYKYQEALFELFTRQYELAKADEGREGALIQVLDAAKPAELKTGPNRRLITLTSGFFALIFLVGASILKELFFTQQPQATV
jgi:uncharacterized protein involved in exopolysaccharide biosynthesis